jgi:phage FluMu protein Com
MKTKEEIDEVYKKLYLSLDDSPHYHTWVRGYTQCQQDMAKQEKVDVVCPKCKGVNEYLISDKGDYKCAYTDCQHKF